MRHAPIPKNELIRALHKIEDCVYKLDAKVIAAIKLTQAGVDSNKSCHGCIACSACFDTRVSIMCTSCYYCFACIYCIDCILCVTCLNCTDCILCTGLQDKQEGYWVLNKKVTEEVYEQAKVDLYAYIQEQFSSSKESFSKKESCNTKPTHRLEDFEPDTDIKH